MDDLFVRNAVFNWCLQELFVIGLVLYRLVLRETNNAE
jgi:hypothetical protein